MALRSSCSTTSETKYTKWSSGSQSPGSAVTENLALADRRGRFFPCSETWHIEPVSFNLNQRFTVEYSDTLLEHPITTTVPTVVPTRKPRDNIIETLKN